MLGAVICLIIRLARYQKLKFQYSKLGENPGRDNEIIEEIEMKEL
jgi:hypothetical protein